MTAASLALEGCAATLVEACGGKARGLALLRKSGLPIPQTWLIPLELGGAEFEGLALDLGSGPWIARSSALAEDSQAASYAGLFESHVVQKRGELWAAIERCRASGASERVRAYQEQRGLGAVEVAIPVVLQVYVEAEISGVAFSLNPQSGRDDEILIEAVVGPGEALVSGRVTPARWVVDWERGEVLGRATGESKDLRDFGSRIPELAREIRRLQIFVGAPQDIEWVYAKGAFQFVQARPITAYAPRPDVGVWTNADFRDGGVAAGPCSPLMSWLYEDAVEASMTRYFRSLGLLRGPKPKWLRSFYARPYWNLGAVKNCLHKLPGFDEQAFERDLGIDRDYGASGPERTPTNLQTLLPAIPVALRLEWGFVQHRWRAASFLAGFENRMRAAEARLTQARENLPRAGWALAEIWRGLQSPTEQMYFSTIYNSTTLKGEFKKMLEALPLSPAPNLLRLLGGLGEVAHFVAERDLDELARQPEERIEAGLAAFLAKHGYRGTHELDITRPRWREDQSFIRESLAQLRQQEARARPQERLAQQVKQYQAERERIEGGLGLVQRCVFRLRLKQTRDYLILRERLRDCSTRAYDMTRRAALLLSEALREEGLLPVPEEGLDPTFLMDLPELLDLSQSRAGAKVSWERLQRRQERLRAFRDWRAPGEVGLRSRPAGGPADSGGLRGIACSPGQVEGPAFVVRSIEEASGIPSGAILVAPYTDPGWTPLFGRIAAVVTEAGGLLSHAAVLSREYGIPAVLAVPGALKAFRSGERLRVDGSLGIVKSIEMES